MASDKIHLPIDDYLEEILSKLATHQNLVLVAEPGAGKTTRLPPALFAHYQKEILVLEPRRVAAVAAADRIAQENAWKLGEQVGYRVRFENKTTTSTRLIFMTEALLARRLLADSELKNVDVVVLDEFHERSLHVDLALGLLRELQEVGATFKIVVMSATLSAEKIAQYLGNGQGGAAPIVRVPGKLFPLAVNYLDKPVRPLPDSNFYVALVQKIKEAFEQTSRDILVFLPGVGEISRLQERLEGWATSAHVDLEVLHGSLGLSEQKRVLQPTTGRRRVLLSTNVAESSLTVDGVTAVVDSGLAKVMRHDLNTGFSRLEMGRISLSSANQRAGRAARQAPGQCYRMWGKNEESSMKKDELAEILRADLSESLLFLAANGVTQPENFSWFEIPQLVSLRRAVADLQNLGAIDSAGSLTPHGRRMIELPLEPRWANFLLLSAENGHLEQASLIVALLQERDVLKAGAAEAYLGDNLENDIMLRLQLLSSGRGYDLKSHIAKNILAVADRLKTTLRSISVTGGLTLDQVMLRAFSNMLCRRRGKSEKALMVGRRGVRLDTNSIVKNSEFFIALQAVELSGSADTVIGMAYGLSRDTVLSTLHGEVREINDLYFDEEKGQIFSRREKRFRDLPLEEPRLSAASSGQTEEQLAEFLTQNLAYVKKHSESVAHWLDRWAAFIQIENTRDYDLSVPLQQAFQMACLGEKKLEVILTKDICYYIESNLPPDLLADFKSAAPAYFRAPTGSKFKIHYPPARSPFVEVRLQELFGIQENPKLLGGNVPLQFHLLGPNYRPQQVTSDIASFWRNTYPEVRKELRVRYPKHSWPENPLLADPVKKGRSTRD